MAWDLAGAIPDLGAEGSAARDEYYAAKYEKAFICHKAYVASRNSSEFYQQATGFFFLAGVGNSLREWNGIIE
ncbi:MAG TPA: hypothetical protein VHQ03_09265 [Candidatus Dormibacteraeota bacterium]|nr:hypothetical protein [Candidatus Dormibacteraeota bacterium]